MQRRLNNPLPGVVVLGHNDVQQVIASCFFQYPFDHHVAATEDGRTPSESHFKSNLESLF